MFGLLVIVMVVMACLVSSPSFAGCCGGKANRQARREARRMERVPVATVAYRATYTASYVMPLARPVYQAFPYLGIAGPSCATGQCPAR